MTLRAFFAVAVATWLALACGERSSPSTTGETHFVKCTTDADCASLSTLHLCVGGQCTDQSASMCAAGGPANWDVEVEGSHGRALASDRESGDVAVVGADALGTVWMSRLTSDGQDRWRRDVIPASVSLSDTPGVAFGPNGGLFFAATYKGAFALDSVELSANELASAVVAKIDQASMASWVRTLSESAGGLSASAVAAEPNGGIVALAAYHPKPSLDPNPAPTGGILIAALGATGDEMWRRVFGSDGVTNAIGSSIAVDEAGDILIVGWVNQGQIDFGGGPVPDSENSRSFVLKLGADGSYRWSRSLSGSLRLAESVAIGGDSGIYVAGNIGNDGVQFTSQPFATKLDTNGNIVWDKSFELGEGNEDVKVAGSCRGALVMTNWGDSTTSGWAIFDVEGDGTWRLSEQEAGESRPYVTAIAPDFHDGLFLAGDRPASSPPTAMFVLHAGRK